MSAHKITRRIALIGFAILGVFAAQLAVAAGPAVAFMGYGEPTFPTFFGAAGSGNGQFAEPTGVAVDQSSNDVYVVDPGNNRIQKFDAEGKYLSQFNVSSPNAIAVDNSAGPSKGHVYVVNSATNVIDKFTSTGTPAGELTGFASTVFGVAVDPSGRVWVAEESGNVKKFSGGEPNAPEGSISPAFSRSPGIAVDSQENVYLLTGESNVAKFDKNGVTLEEQLTVCGCVTERSLAIDPGNNDLFASQGSLIARYGPFGKPYRSPIEKLEGSSYSRGIAVNGTTHTVYASQPQANTVAIFKFVLLPDVTTGAANEVNSTSAKLSGEVNPDGQAVTSCRFEYGTSEAYGQTLPCTPAPGSGSSPVAVSVEASLTPHTDYHFRLVAGNANGTHAGADQTFSTPVPAPVILGNPSASFVAAQSAVLNATLNPEHTTTHYHFEYGACPTLTGCATIQSTAAEVSAVYGTIGTSAEIVGLSPATTYAYRLAAVNEFEETGQRREEKTTGAEGTFTTVPASIPRVETSAYTVLGATSAVISGLVEPHGVPTSYAFELGIYNSASTQYGIVFSGSAGASNVPVPVSLTLTGLQPGATYAYRLTISSGYILNETHTLAGAAAVFMTPGLTTVLEVPPILAQLPIPNIPLPKTIKPPGKHKKTIRKRHGNGKNQKSKKARRSGTPHKRDR